MIANVQVAALIALGGAAGSLSRFFVTEISQHLVGSDWPYGTLLVNVLGSLTIGFIAELSLNRFGIVVQRELSALIITGFLGAFTTFSSFSLETLNLVQRGQWWLASANLLLTVCLCLFAVFAGSYLAKFI